MTIYKMDAKQTLLLTLRVLWKGLITIIYYTQIATQIAWITIKTNYNRHYNISSPPVIVKPLEFNYEDKYAKYKNFYLITPDYEANKQINSNLYSIQTRKTLFEDPNNQLEKQWKSRILIEHTTNGNIIMYYDCYRMEFVYYSDMQIVPNKALHYASMKYVVMYRCRDFFIDMDNFPNNKMIDLLKTEDEKLKTKTPSKFMEERKDLAPVMLKPKIYKDKNSTKKQTEINKPHLYTNKYIRIGKMADFNILQKSPNKNIARINKMMFEEKPNTIIADFFDDSNLKGDILEDDDLEIKETVDNKINLFEPIGEKANPQIQQKKTDYAAFKQMLKLKQIEQIVTATNSE